MGALSTKEKAKLYDFIKSIANLEYDWNGPKHWVIVINRWDIDEEKLSDSFTTAVKQAVKKGAKDGRI